MNYETLHVKSKLKKEEMCRAKSIKKPSLNTAFRTRTYFYFMTDTSRSNSITLCRNDIILCLNIIVCRNKDIE